MAYLNDIEDGGFVEVLDPIDAVLSGVDVVIGGHKRHPKHKHPKHKRPVRHAPKHASQHALRHAVHRASSPVASDAMTVPADAPEDTSALTMPADDAPPPDDLPSPDDGGGGDGEPDEPESEDDSVGACLDECDVDLNGFFDFIAVPFKAIVKVATAPIHLLEKIPVIGGPIHAVVGASPIGLVEHVAAGERLDHAFLNHLKDNVHAVHELAPYATMVVSLVPGVGTGVAAAIAAGAALAEGRSITDAVLEGVKGAIPGGKLAQTGFDSAVRIAKGQNVGKVALQAAREQLPAEARKAFDIGVAAMTGQSIQNAVIAAVGSLAPAQVKTLLATGAKVVKDAPGLAKVAKSLPDPGARNGFALAAGLLAHKGTTGEALSKARSKLQGSARVGFDALLHAQEKHFPAAAKALHGPSTKESIANAAASIQFAMLIQNVPGTGLTLLFPVNMSATAATIAADRVMRVAEGQRGTPVQRKQVSDAIVRTNALAAKGNADAKRTLSFMALAKNVRGATQVGGKSVPHAKDPKRAAPKPHEPATELAFVHSNGAIERGRWKKVPKGTSGAVFGPAVDGSRRVARGYFVRLS